MKIFFSTILFLLLFSLPSHTLTNEQLESADATLDEVLRIVIDMKEDVQIAKEMKAGRLVLTPAQKQWLIDDYNDLKSELPSLFNQLP